MLGNCYKDFLTDSKTIFSLLQYECARKLGEKVQI